MFSLEEKYLWMSNLGIGEKDGIAAEKRLRFSGRDQDFKLCIG